MESITKQAFRLNLFVMEVLGLYFIEKPSFLNKFRAYFTYFVLTIPIPLLGILYIFIEDDFDLNNSAFVLTEISCQVAKLLPMLRKRDKVKECIHYFDSPIFKVVKKTQKEFVDGCIRVCQRNSQTFLISVVIASSGWAITPFLLKERSLPLDLWLPFDPLEKSGIYFIIFGFLVLEVAYASFACAAVDPLIGGLAYLGASQFRILKDNLQNLSEDADQEILKENGNVMIKSQIIHKKIRKCIRHHNEILKFVKEYEECFSWGVFSQISGSTLVICFCCLELSKLQPFTFNFISMITCLSCFLVQIYLYCYYGTILFEESNTLTNAIYIGKWYDYDEKAKRTLIVMMEFSKKPVIVTAGKILELSVETFAMILRRSYSLLAVLKNS